MKLIIAIPCMDMVHVKFVRSLLLLNTNGYDATYEIRNGSLVYDARNQLLATAKQIKADRILWLDSDMEFSTDMLQQLSADIDNGCDIVSGLYFKRKPPHTPVIYKECAIQKITPDQLMPLATSYENYPKESLFEVEAFGFGCVLMNMAAASKVTGELGMMPFMPAAGFGEDLSFCMRAKHVGLKLWCDSRVKCGHIGYRVYTEEDSHG